MQRSFRAASEETDNFSSVPKNFATSIILLAECAAHKDILWAMQ